jgi:hypothetical protein
MFANYLLIAWRTLMRDKLFSALNIFGLAIGVVACMLIYIYVQDELSFDAHHAKADRIFRIQSHFNFGDQSDDFGLTQFAMVPTLLQEYPEIESGSWLYVLNNCTFNYEGTQLHRGAGWLLRRHGLLPNLRLPLAAWRSLPLWTSRTMWSSPSAWRTRCSEATNPWGSSSNGMGESLTVAGVIDHNGTSTPHRSSRLFPQLARYAATGEGTADERMGTSEQLRVPRP